MVGAGKETWLSNSDWLIPSIFRRKMEWKCPMIEEKDIKSFYFQPESAFCFDV